MTPYDETTVDFKQFCRVPAWWVTGPEDVRAFCKAVTRGRTRKAGLSGGGKRIEAVVFAARRPKATLVIFGGTHGNEPEGTAACVNLMNILDKGRDLLGRKWRDIEAVAARLSFIIFPIYNVDAAARSPVRTFTEMRFSQVKRLAYGQWKNGRTCSRKFMFRNWSTRSDKDRVLERLRFLGLRYNDAGRLVCRPVSLEETMAVETESACGFLRGQTADCLVDIHAHSDPVWIGTPGRSVARDLLAKAESIMRCAKGYARARGKFALQTSVMEDGELQNPAFFCHNLRIPAFTLELKAAYLGVHAPGVTPYGPTGQRDRIMRSNITTCLHAIAGIARGLLAGNGS
jgi:hypothetical protein